ncbi:hypothetical protein P775_17300 [Puniceibacterium antarcticum]|uniref:Transposase InsH N-terminal domain-containing protein n=1 Tax=Puniceibacterium antarcticum TaxID=1206336 RepID=A0A2G8RBI2_9RHOB|nr:hypothetical protein P775_17300 [Puniceibacterium antarcticum]
MKPHPRQAEQDDLLRPRLTDMIDMRHELAKLAALIDWDFFEREWAGFFLSHRGRPATSPRLVAGLLYVQHAYRLSDEAVIARWVENPYYQHFTGETFFQHRPPIDPSSLTRWRNRIGEERAEWLLTKTIEAGRNSGALDNDSLSCVAVDTTVMEKNIAHPTPLGNCLQPPAGQWTRGCMTRLDGSSSHWQTTPESRCARTTTVWHRAWPCRPAATPMRASSSACARP